MFEKFTERARHVVVLAQEEARAINHNYIGTEHVLLGLLREAEGQAARVLESLGVTVDAVRAEVLEIVGAGDEATAGQIPFTPRAKKVLELALREALMLGHNYIGTEHILLGLVRENEGVAARILRGRGADPERVRDATIRLLSGTPQPEALRSRASRAAPGGDPVGRAMASIEREIRARLSREPDNGDLLVILASLPEGIVGRALAALGIDDERLDAALAQAREAAPDAIEDQLAQVRGRKDAAIDERRYEDAARARDRERVLVREQNADLIGRVRARLGLPG